MKTVVISDTHLSGKVYPKKFRYLKSIIEDADKVILAGDFWDGFVVSFDKFVNSEWQMLFPLLRERQAVYLYGNHDRPEWCDERVSLFSVKSGADTSLSVGGQLYHITHGHTILTPYDDRLPVLNHKVPLRIGSHIDLAHKAIWGKRFLGRKSRINAPMAKWAANNLSEEQVLITGHSHYPEIDLSRRFINSGFIGLGYGNYVVIYPSGPRVIKERY